MGVLGVDLEGQSEDTQPRNKVSTEEENHITTGREEGAGFPDKVLLRAS